MPTWSAGSRDLCQPRTEADGKPVTESNLSLRAPAQRAAYLHVSGPFGGAWLEVSRSGNLALVCWLWQVAALSVSRRCPTLVRTAVGAQHWWIMASG